MSDKIPLKWTGAVLDSSGYASAARNYICSLLDTGKIDLTVGAVSFEKQYTSHGEMSERINPYINKELENDYKIHVVHLTPENYQRVAEKDKYNIAYTVWETDRLPEHWVKYCNQMDEIWVPSQWNKSIFIESGIRKPVVVIPHGININTKKRGTHIAIGAEEDTFVFYTIAQWHERKNPLSLLKAYLTEFKPDENVCLALKVYRINTSAKEQNLIKSDIANIKRNLNMEEFPPMRFFGNLLSADQMRGFHQRGDCFVLAHRAEGFGLTQAEAMAYGKPVISTGYSGNMEFMNNGNSYLINYQETPVYNMIFPHYNGAMTWADPDVSHLKKLMRHVFENREEARRVGERAKQDMQEKFNWQKISEVMINRLTKIHNNL